MPYQPYQSTWNNPYLPQTTVPQYTGYQPTVTQPYQQPVNGIVKVNGRDSATQYNLPPNSMSPALFDKDVKTIDHNTYYEACDEMQEKLRDVLGDDYLRIEVFDRRNFKDRTVNLGINWAAIGTVDPEMAVEFATKMMQVAAIVEQFPYNGYVVTR